MPHRSCTAQSLSIAAQILRCRGTFFFCYSGAIFERSRSLSIDYSGAKYARSVPKIDLAWNHFFEQLKTAVLLIDYETATLKSLPSRGSDASHVHPRPRKRPPRCTLDCGFKTPESPALRGFVAERAPIRGTSLYLVLKSNGLRHLKNLPVKFDFSPIDTPANIAKKLPLQRCPKPLFIAFFNFSHKQPTFAFMGKNGYTLGFQRKIAHSGPHGETGGISGGGGITTLGAFHTVRKPCAAGYQNGALCRFWVLVGDAPEERRKPSEQRCAYARRCSEGVAAPLGCAALTVEFLAFLLLLKTTIANSLTPWYYGVTKSEAIG